MMKKINWWILFALLISLGCTRKRSAFDDVRITNHFSGYYVIESNGQVLIIKTNHAIQFPSP